MELDRIDQLAAAAFDTYLVRKDLVRKYSRQYPIPTYVVEFLLGRYCATVDEKEIEEGLQIVERQLRERTVTASQAELFKAKSREKGSEKLIDLVKARLDSKHDCFIAELPSLNLRDARISDELVHDHERMLLDGFYAEVSLGYDATIALEQNGRPFAIESLRPIQLSSPDVLDVFQKARESFTTEEWIDFLIRSIGLESENLTDRAKWVALLRMVPYVERKLNSARGEPGRAISTSRSLPTPILCREGRRQSRSCSSTWAMVRGDWSASTT
jgi:ATP-dependent Lon protease